MTREIDQADIDAGNLSWEEAEYLRVRGQLPDDYEMPDGPEEEETEPAVKKSRIVPLEDQESPTIGRNGGIVEDEEAEDYDVGWNNDQRRAELSERGLSVEGDKAAMMARLVRYDNDESLDEDQAE